MKVLGNAVMGSLYLTLVLSSFSYLVAQEKRISKKEVPDTVLSAFDKAYPKAKVKGYTREIEDGKTFYEIESINGRASLDVTYLAGGTVAEVEEGMSARSLPVPVKKTLKAKYSDGVIVKAEKTTRNGVVTYEVKTESATRTLTLTLDLDGSIIEAKSTKR